MRLIIHFSLAFFCMITLSSCASQTLADDSKEKQASSKAVIQWLNALETKDADTAWDLTSKIITTRYEKDFVFKYWLGSKESLGKVLKADQQLNWKYKNQRSSMPDGQYRRIVYWVKFENKTLSKNEFIVSYEEDKWKLVQWSSY